MPRHHALALLTPWYASLRAGVEPLDERPRHPTLQKYVTPDFVPRLLADPRDSEAFDGDDRWSYPVPIGAASTPRQRLTTHTKVTTPLRKLYQPSHQRFYAVTIELVCDEPGFPRLADRDGLEVGFVVRRLRTDIQGTRRRVKLLARAVTCELFATDPPSYGEADLELARDVGSLLRLPHTLNGSRPAFEARHSKLLSSISFEQTLEGWHAGSGGPGRWAPVPDPGEAPPGDALPAEQEWPMWPLPAMEGACARAQTRSIWFGMVPTYSGELDAGGAPKLDDHSVYVLQCFVRQAPDHEGCPPRVWWSAASEPFRLAAFFDPDGTKNQRVRVKLPDLRALAARAGTPVAGGVTFERPPGSQLQFGSIGEIPTEGTVGGDASESCTFSIELITIVASFVFSLFLPVVVLVFQLWWLLALKFCWPRNDQAIQALETYFAGGGTLPLPTDELAEAFASVVGVVNDGQQALDRLQTTTDPPLDPATAVVDLVAVAKGDDITDPAPPVAEPKPADPLCEPVTVP